MTTTVVRRICIMVALCSIFLAVSLLLNPTAEGVASAAETLPGWGGYGELPPVW
jgi:hypothetical protein